MYCQDNGIVLQAFSPLAMGKKMDDPTLVEIAKRCNKSPGQVLIRYSLQKAWAPLPKSGNEERIKENADVFDFEVSEEDMAALDALEKFP
jgi:diketogulonate reductase-like aldo/keto reductase